MKRIATALLLLLLGCGSVNAGTLSTVSNERWVTVGRILDGDTFKTVDGESIRLLGLNTPEIQHRDSAAQPLGDEATLALRRLIDGKVVKLRFDKEKKDIYGRTLAQIYDRRGHWVNGLMVEQGWAHVYTFVPNTHWAQSLLRAEHKARTRKLGIWNNPRWKILAPSEIKESMLGQFRVIQGVVRRPGRHGRDFYLANIHITVPKKYREYFIFPLPVTQGDQVTVRGRIRSAGDRGWFLSLHAPTDLEVD